MGFWFGLLSLLVIHSNVAGRGSHMATRGIFCLTNNIADRAGGVRDDLSGVFSWLYKLMRRSTSAE